MFYNDLSYLTNIYQYEAPRQKEMGNLVYLLITLTPKTVDKPAI